MDSIQQNAEGELLSGGAISRDSATDKKNRTNGWFTLLTMASSVWESCVCGFTSVELRFVQRQFSDWFTSGIYLFDLMDLALLWLRRL